MCTVISPDNNNKKPVKIEYFLTHQFKHLFWALKRTVPLVEHYFCYALLSKGMNSLSTDKPMFVTLLVTHSTIHKCFNSRLLHILKKQFDN